MPQEILPVRAYQLTLSVKGDLSPESQDLYLAYVRKHTLMHYVVIELGANGRRHLHSLLIFKRDMDPRKLKDNVWSRYIKPYHPDSMAKRAVLIQVCPGNRWYDEYLQKEVSREVLSDTWNREQAESYFPSQAIQEALIEKSKQGKQACPWLTEDVNTWSESTFENTPEGALMYLKDRMFVKRNLVPISDPRKRTEKALMYWEYRNGVISPSERELWLLKQLQDGPSYDVPAPRHEPFSSAPPSI